MKAQHFEQAQRAEQRGNREGRDLWDRYAGHRERLTAEILRLAPEGGEGRVCLLGAGNTNDVDLAQLATRYAEIHLVDIDPGALSRSVGRQSAEVRARLRSHAPVDLSGLYHQLDSGRLPDQDVLVERGVAAVISRLPGAFDLAVSCCIISQMSWSLARTAGEDQALFTTLDQAMVNVHLRALLSLVKVDRPALVVADLVSSDRYPLDAAQPPSDLRALVDELAYNRLAYAACNPELMRRLIRSDRALAALCDRPQIGTPWLWDGSQERTYLVYPMLIRRQS
jgi:hypothetical protein